MVFDKKVWLNWIKLSQACSLSVNANLLEIVWIFGYYDTLIAKQCQSYLMSRSVISKYSLMLTLNLIKWRPNNQNIELVFNWLVQAWPNCANYFDYGQPNINRSRKWKSNLTDVHLVKLASSYEHWHWHFAIFERSDCVKCKNNKIVECHWLIRNTERIHSQHESVSYNYNKCCFDFAIRLSLESNTSTM